ncbi:hypothetical protein CCMA1212_002117 [Trichoderma ghanense]|uniref:Uncharacterized protein n=1 Tax=Trichoderma ghanense TaxID=65468 RepID=A0ABY2HEF7_9HYPO
MTWYGAAEAKIEPAMAAYMIGAMRAPDQSAVGERKDGNKKQKLSSWAGDVGSSWTRSLRRQLEVDET